MLLHLAFWPHYEINTQISCLSDESIRCSLPLPTSSPTFRCSYSSLRDICCPPFNLSFFSPLSHMLLRPCLHLFLTILLRTIPPCSHFLFSSACSVFPPGSSLFHSKNYLGVVKMVRLYMRQSFHHTFVFVWACVGVYITPIRAHIHCLAS